jgi:alpha-amylase
MMPVTLLLGIHNHQPVGNFDHVFRLAYDRCYRPFLDILERHPRIRLSLHYTGPLLSWFEKEEPSFLDRLRRLVQAKQIEMLGGGFYEPIFSVIPDRDAVGQMKMLSRRLLDRVDAEARGFWLAERVWDGGLPKKLAPAGLRYTILDDSHFMRAGLDPETLSGYYVTEREGHRLSLFPISKDTRYLIPFRLPQELIAFLGKVRERGGHWAVTYADDGEKFGMWPGTYKWVFEEGYLERLFAALEEHADWIHLTTFAEYLDAHAPTGRVYLPSASYDEMMDWALPAIAAESLEDRRAELEREGRLPGFLPFLHGGFWDGFLVKYPEANHMHKRMLDLSDRVSQLGSEDMASEPRDLLWRAQDNDVYWHGLFGGLYLNNLRHEMYRNLIAAEILVDRAVHRGKDRWLDVRVFDLDMDGLDEILVSTPTLAVCIAPAYGGSLVELDYRAARFNLLNVLARRREAYHGKLALASGQADSGGPPKSIHDMIHVKEPGLERALIYDGHRRVSFLDRFLDPGARWEEFDRIDDVDRGNCVGGTYRSQSREPTVKAGKLKLPLAFDSVLRLDGQQFPVQVQKEYQLTDREEQLTVHYVIVNQGQAACEVRFGIELNLTLLAGDDPKRYYEWPGSQQIRLRERGECRQLEWFALVDEWHRFRVVLRLDRPADIWYMPIETVSQSEEGFERTYQGSALLVSSALRLVPGAPERLEAQVQISEL